MLAGLAKGGFSGLGVAAIPLLSLVMDPVEAAALMLPILIVQDVAGVWSFRHDFDRDTLLLMLPAAALGVALGWLLSSSVSADSVRLIVGLIAIAFGGHRLLKLKLEGARPMPRWVGAFWGMVSGFTSHIAHAGGPPFQVWAMTRGFPHLKFAGTSSIYFAIVNWMKVPAYLALGQFTTANLRISALLLPFALASTFAGVWLVKRIPAERFFTIINVLMVIVGLQLIRVALL